MIASICGPTCGTPLFLHVLGAIALFGGVGTVAVLAVAALRERTQTAMLQRAAFMTTLLLVWPAYVVMRVGAQWVASNEHLDKNPPGWVGRFGRRHPHPRRHHAARLVRSAAAEGRKVLGRPFRSVRDCLGRRLVRDVRQARGLTEHLPMERERIHRAGIASPQ
jgi:hypothetical protein